MAFLLHTHFAIQCVRLRETLWMSKGMMEAKGFLHFFINKSDFNFQQKEVID